MAKLTPKMARQVEALRRILYVDPSQSPAQPEHVLRDAASELTMLRNALRYMAQAQGVETRRDGD